MDEAQERTIVRAIAGARAQADALRARRADLIERGLPIMRAAPTEDDRVREAERICAEVAAIDRQLAALGQ